MRDVTEAIALHARTLQHFQLAAERAYEEWVRARDKPRAHAAIQAEERWCVLRGDREEYFGGGPVHNGLRLTFAAHLLDVPRSEVFFETEGGFAPGDASAAALQFARDAHTLYRRMPGRAFTDVDVCEMLLDEAKDQNWWDHKYRKALAAALARLSKEAA